MLLLLIGLFAARGESWRDAAFDTSAGHELLLLGDFVADDSWGPMLSVYRSQQECPACRVYDNFFQAHVKFQYPPTAMLLMQLFPHWALLPCEASAADCTISASTPGGMQLAFRHMVTEFSLICVLITMTLVLVLFFLLTRNDARSTATNLITAGALLLLCLLFYPLLRGFTLGQVQVIINMLIALSAVAYCMDRRALAGLAIGACCMIKPQYALILLWGLLRRETRFLVGALSVCALGFAWSLWQFRAVDYLDYLKVLSFLSHHPEAFWLNQSIAGFLNRLLGVGDPLNFDLNVFPSFNLWVYSLTLIFLASLTILTFRRISGHRDEQQIDFAMAILAATIASPIVWDHHYGCLLPVFVIATVMAARTMPFGKATPWLLGIAYLAVADVVFKPAWLLHNPLTTAVLSHMLLGALALFTVLASSRRAASLRATPSEATVLQVKDAERA